MNDSSVVRKFRTTEELIKYSFNDIFKQQYKTVGFL